MAALFVVENTVKKSGDRAATGPVCPFPAKQPIEKTDRKLFASFDYDV